MEGHVDWETWKASQRLEYRKYSLMPGRNGGTLRRGGPGRPKGSKSRQAALRAEVCRQLGNEESLSQIVATLWRMAIHEGDIVAMDILTDKLFPRAR